MYDVLCEIARKFNDADILWAVGASIMLEQHGLIDHPTDIDMLVHTDDIETADRILRSMGVKKGWEKHNQYATRFFYEYQINGIEVDVMSGLALNHVAGTYECDFDRKSITDFFTLDEVDVPMTSLEDWYVIYQLISGREEKVQVINKRLTGSGVHHPELLERALMGCLPPDVRFNIVELLK